MDFQQDILTFARGTNRGTRFLHIYSFWLLRFFQETISQLGDSKQVILSLSLLHLLMIQLFFVKDKQPLNRILKLMANFELFSSLKASIEKCEVCWLDKSKYGRDKPGHCKLISLVIGSIKTLGVHFSLDKTLSIDKNVSDLLTEMRAIIKTWKIRNLTLKCKVIIFRSLIASKPVKIASLVHTPKCVVEAIQIIHKESIWDNKKSKIKHSTTIVSYCDGGLKGTDIEAKFQSLKFSWITWLKD